MHRPYTRGQNPDPNSRVTAKITAIAMGTPTPYAAYRVGRHGKVNPGTPNQRASTRRNASSVLTCMGQPPGAGDVVTAGADGGAGGDVACRPSRLSNHFPMPNPNEESRPMATTARDAATRPMVSITLEVSPLRDAPSRPKPMMSMINGSALSFSQPLIPSLDTVTSARYRVPAMIFRVAVLVITGALPPWAGACATPHAPGQRRTSPSHNCARFMALWRIVWGWQATVSPRSPHPSSPNRCPGTPTSARNAPPPPTRSPRSSSNVSTAPSATPATPARYRTSKAKPTSSASPPTATSPNSSASTTAAQPSPARHPTHGDEDPITAAPGLSLIH